MQNAIDLSIVTPMSNKKENVLVELYPRPAINLSIVAPVYNEESVIVEFHKRLTAVLDAIGQTVEVIYINDGSRDNSLAILRHLQTSDKRMSIIDFSRNFGKEYAMTAGMNKARGKAVVVIDSDLQDQPELIPDMLAKWRDGYDVVLMKRSRRKGETWLKKATARMFYKVIKKISYITIPENVGDFRLMSRKVVEALQNCPEEIRFMKGLFAWQGFRTATIEYERDVRAGGHSAYGYWKLWNFALDGLTSFSTAPLKIPLYLGFITVLFSFGYALAQFGFMTNHSPNAGLITGISLIGGIQFLILGIMGEYLARISVESKRRPLYIIDKVYTPGEVHDSQA